MPNHRKPVSKHLLAGTYRTDRHGHPIQVEPIDPTPPPHLVGADLAAWNELVQSGEQYMAQSDRISVELAARLVAKMRAGEIKAAEVGQLNTLLGKLGLSPSGRRGLDPVRPPAGEANPFEDY
jgi:hypothetical protein